MAFNPFDEFDGQTGSNPFDEFDTLAIRPLAANGFDEIPSAELEPAPAVFPGTGQGFLAPEPSFSPGVSTTSLRGQYQQPGRTPTPEESAAARDSFTSQAKDVGLAGVAGLSSIPRVAGQVLKMTGAEETGSRLTDIADERSKFYTGLMSEEGQKALLSPVIKEGEGGWEWGDSPFSTILLSSAQSVPGMVGMAPVGGVLAGGVKALRIAPRVAKAIAGLGVSGRIARRIGHLAPTALGYGSAEGLWTGLENAEQAGRSVAEMPEEDLAKSPAYQKLLAETGDAGKARKEIQEQVETQTFLLTAPTTAVVGVATGGGIMGKMARKAKGSAIKQVLGGGLAESVQEGFQSGGETIAGNIVTKGKINPDQNLMAGVLEAMVGGAGSGGLIGLAGGGAGLPFKRKAVAPSTPQTPPTPRTPADIMGIVEADLYEGKATPEEVRAAIPALEKSGVAPAEVERILHAFTDEGLASSMEDALRAGVSVDEVKGMVSERLHGQVDAVNNRIKEETHQETLAKINSATTTDELVSAALGSPAPVASVAGPSTDSGATGRQGLLADADAAYQEYQPELPPQTKAEMELERQARAIGLQEARRKLLGEQALALPTPPGTIYGDGFTIKQDTKPQTIRRANNVGVEAPGDYVVGTAQTPAVTIAKVFKTEKNARVSLKSRQKKGKIDGVYDVFPVEGGFQIQSARTEPGLIEAASQKKAQGVAAESIIRANPVYAMIMEARKYPLDLNLVERDYPDFAAEIVKKFPGILKRGGPSKPDAFAESHGYSYDGFIEELKASVPMSQMRAPEFNRNPAYYEELKQAGFVPVGDKMVAGSLRKGDKVIGRIAGGQEEEFTVLGQDSQSRVVMQGAGKEKVDLFDDVQVEFIKTAETEAASQEYSAVREWADTLSEDEFGYVAAMVESYAEDANPGRVIKQLEGMLATRRKFMADKAEKAANFVVAKKPATGAALEVERIATAELATLKEFLAQAGMEDSGITMDGASESAPGVYLPFLTPRGGPWAEGENFATFQPKANTVIAFAERYNHVVDLWASKVTADKIDIDKLAEWAQNKEKKEAPNAQGNPNKRSGRVREPAKDDANLPGSGETVVGETDGKPKDADLAGIPEPAAVKPAQFTRGEGQRGGAPDASVSSAPSGESATPKEPWQMTGGDYAAQQLAVDEYRAEIVADPEEKANFEADRVQDWRRAVEKEAESHRIPTAVLDDFVARFGEQVFHSTFRGRLEKGIAGWQPKDVRVWDKTYRQYLKMREIGVGNGEHKEMHRAAIKRAIEDGEVIPAAVLADYPALAAAQTGKANPEAVEQAQGNPADVGGVQGRSAAGKVETSTEDVGRELSYNKRNRMGGLKWADLEKMDLSLRVREATKAKVSPRPDYQGLIDFGMNPQVAHIVKQAYDAIPSHPSKTTDEAIQQYIAAINKAMGRVMAWAESDASGKWLGAMSGWPSRRGGLNRGLTAIAAMAETGERDLYDTVFPDGWRAQRQEAQILGQKFVSAIQPGPNELAKAMKDIGKGWPGAVKAWKKQGYSIVDGDGATAKVYLGDTEKRGKYASVQIKLNNRSLIDYAIIEGVENESAPAITEYIRETLSGIHGKKLLLDKNKRLVGAFETQEAAELAAEGQTKRGGKEPTVSDKGISVEAAARQGKPRRAEGENISTERLAETFGFSGVNFGNWMKGKANENERQLHVNHAFDSFMDLADILGIQPEAISLGGILGIAVGAQGNGKYAAHFVPGVNEINLTRASGAGSLAHEWAHALDHYFARQAGLGGEMSPFITAAKGREKGEIRPEIAEHFRKIVSAMSRRQMTEAERSERVNLADNQSKKNIAGWLAAIKRQMVSGLAEGVNVQVGGKDVSALAEIDRLVEKIQSGDIGTEKIQVSHPAGRGSMATFLSPAVSELRNLHKTLHGRAPALDNFKGLQSNLDSLKYRESSETEKSAHIPQTYTGYYANAKSLDNDKGGKPYWSTDVEMFARAFDAYVSDKLAEREARNTYLSHAGRDNKTTPMGEDRAAINSAIDALVAELKTKETDKGVALFSRANKTSWPAGFPNATTHTTLSKLKSHVDYDAAKAGDIAAAIRVVADLVSRAKVKELKQRHPSAIVLAPHAIEEAGRNAIPRVLAEAFGDAGFEVNTDVVQTNEPHRTKKDSPLRLVLRPEFAGKVEAGKEYILIDDAIGQGGTVAELRFFVESNGGRVVDVSALTSGIFGNKLSIRSETITNLKEKFSREKLKDFLYEFNTAGSIDALTEKEGRFILQQPSLNSLRDRILAGAREAGISPSAWQVQASFSRLASLESPFPEVSEGQTTGNTVLGVKYSIGTEEYKRFGWRVNNAQKEATNTLSRIIGVKGITAWRLPDSLVGGDRKGRVYSGGHAQGDFDLSRRLARVFEKQIVWATIGERFKYNGVVIMKNKALADTIFIDIRTDKPTHTVLGHELSHHMEQDSPELYSALYDSLEPIIKDIPKYADMYGYGGKPNTAIRKEIIGDLLGDNFNNESFWRQVADNSGGKFKKIANKILRWIDGVLAKLRGAKAFESDQFVSDVEQAREVLAIAVAEYAEGRGQGGVAGLGEALYGKEVQQGIERDTARATVKESLTVEGLSPAYAGSLSNSGAFSESNDIRYSQAEIKAAAKAFFSKLQQVASGAFQGAKAQSVLPFLVKNGVKKAELEAAGIPEFLAGKKPTDKVTAQELSDFVRANAVELEDVVLGGAAKENSTMDGGWTRFEFGSRDEMGTYDSRQEALSAAEDAEEAQQDYWESTTREPEENDDGVWEVRGVDYRDETFPTEQEALDFLEGEREWIKHESTKLLEGARNISVTDHDGNTLFEAELTKPTGPAAHFSRYTEPGAVEGSYREMFVTAPKMPSLNAGSRRRYGKSFTELSDPEVQGLLDSPVSQSWQDGHSQYSSVVNPVVRIRFNEVEADGKRILRIEEMQGPSAENQKKMPAYLKNNIYQLGVKRILAYAKENGFDGVALTTKPGMSAGSTQVDRYSLEKQIDELRYTPSTGMVDGYKDGKIVLSKQATLEQLPTFIGKDAAKKLLSSELQPGQREGLERHVLKGEGLKTGGEGLKRLYDTDLPRMFEAYGKGKMSLLGEGVEKFAMYLKGGATPYLAGNYTRAEADEILHNFPGKYEAKKSFAGTDEANMPYISIVNSPEAFPLFSRQAEDDLVARINATSDNKETPALAKYKELVATLEDDKKDIFAKQKALETHIAKHLPKAERWRVLPQIKNIAKPVTREGRQAMLDRAIAAVEKAHQAKLSVIAKILTEKDIIQRRKASIRNIRDYLGLTDDDLRKVDKRDIRLMSNLEFKIFKDGLFAKAVEMSENRWAKLELLNLIYTRRLQKVENLQQALKLPPISQMSKGQLESLFAILSNYDVGDKFLSVRQLERVDMVPNLKGIRTWREAKEKLAEEAGMTVEDLSKIKYSWSDDYRWDSALYERDPFYRLLVGETTTLLMGAQIKYNDLEKEYNRLAKASDKSRRRAILERAIPQDKQVFDYTETEPGREKDALAKKMTPEQLTLAGFIQDYLGKALEYLVESRALEQGRKNYFPHMGRSFWEGWKDDGFMSAVKGLMESYEQDQEIFNILAGDTGHILPMEKFFAHSLHRAGQLTPSKNIHRVFLAYAKLFEKKRALDILIPKMVIYTKALTPEKETPRGLEFDRSIQAFVNEYINNKKGRRTDFGRKLPQGGTADVGLNSLMTLTALLDLGGNIAIGLASLVGEQGSNYVMLGGTDYVKGAARMRTTKGKLILQKYRAFTGRSLWEEFTDSGQEAPAKAMLILFGLFHINTVASNKQFLLGSLTAEEYSAGKIGGKRLAEIQLNMGRFRVVGGTSSIVGSTSLGRAGTQYKRWAAPILSSTAKDIKTFIAGRAEGSRFTTKEAREIYRIIGLTSVALMVGSLGGDDDESLWGRVKAKAYRESMSLIQGLDSGFWLSAPRVMTFLVALGKNIQQLSKMEGYKKKPGLKGVEGFKRQFTPAIARQFRKPD